MTIQKIAAVVAAVALTAPVAAFADMNSSAIVIATSNNGVLLSNTTSTANTGSNTAGGSRGGRGGSGGDVEVEGAGDGNNGGSTAGNGGTGGNGGPGGLVETGDAESDAGSISSLNSNDIDVGGDGEDMNSSAVVIALDNASGISVLAQNTGSGADTGANNARGSRGGRGGSGGEIEVDGDGDGNNGGAEAGTGGNGGTGGLGGEVVTGDSTSNAGSIQMMNTNLVRVRN